MIHRQDVEFPALDGTVLRAWLFQPDTETQIVPAVTMSHGFSATRWHGIEKTAIAFAEAGFAVLFHDHRGWGGSDGEPRQDIDPWKQIEDWRQAISFLESIPFVDASRLGIWGTSYSGGHAIVLGATDRRLRAVVAQAPTIDGWVSGQRRVPPGSVAALEAEFDEDLRGQLRGYPPTRIKIADLNPDVRAQYHTRDTVDFLTQAVPEGMWRNELTIQSNRRSRMYEPGRWISRISPTPFLMIATTHDTTAPSDLTLGAYENALEPKALKLIPGGHYTPYLEGFDECSKAATDWFVRHL